MKGLLLALLVVIAALAGCSHPSTPPTSTTPASPAPTTSTPTFTTTTPPAAPTTTKPTPPTTAAGASCKSRFIGFVRHGVDGRVPLFVNASAEGQASEFRWDLVNWNGTLTEHVVGREFRFNVTIPGAYFLRMQAFGPGECLLETVAIRLAASFSGGTTVPCDGVVVLDSGKCAAWEIQVNPGMADVVAWAEGYTAGEPARWPAKVYLRDAKGVVVDMESVPGANSQALYVEKASLTNFTFGTWTLTYEPDYVLAATEVDMGFSALWDKSVPWPVFPDGWRHP